MHRPVRYKVSEPRRVGKVAKVVYACRGPMMMDGHERQASAMRAFDRQQTPRRETPSHRGPSAWRRGFLADRV